MRIHKMLPHVCVRLFLGVLLTVLFCIYDYGSIPPQLIPVLPRTLVEANTTQNGSRCIRTMTTPGFLVCPYTVERDRFISKALLSSGLWEPKMTHLFQKIFNETSNATFVDIGANIGYFSLLAAKMGHHVIGIEPVKENLQKIGKAIILNKLGKNIQLFANAISNTRGRVTIVLSNDNQGGHRILEDHELSTEEVKTDAVAVFMDDIVGYIPTTNAILKLDVEGHECKVMAQTDRLFKILNVTYIIMEWKKMMFDRHRYGVSCPAEDIQAMTNRLTERGYVPYDVKHDMELKPHHSDRWTSGDVYWKHRQA